MKTPTTQTYYRIQPAGLSLDHDSESSAGEAHGLDVFESAFETTRTDCGYRAYGDEVVVIEGGASWANGDVEGVRIDGRAAKIVARYPVSVWREAWEAATGDGRGDASDEPAFFEALRELTESA